MDISVLVIFYEINTKQCLTDFRLIAHKLGSYTTYGGTISHSNQSTTSVRKAMVCAILSVQ